MNVRIDGDTVAEAARKIGVSKTRVYRLVERGRIRVLAKGQPRRGGATSLRGQFVGAGMVLDREDVQREANARKDGA